MFGLVTPAHIMYNITVHSCRYLHTSSQYECCPDSSVGLDICSRNVFMPYPRGYCTENEFIPHGKNDSQSSFMLSSLAIAWSCFSPETRWLLIVITFQTRLETDQGPRMLGTTIAHYRGPVLGLGVFCRALSPFLGLSKSGLLRAFALRACGQRGPTTAKEGARTPSASSLGTYVLGYRVSRWYFIPD